ncbi:hypothetical protein [Variovorax sp. dw_954]|uniref:hypothetical protein n=1 Tax=Variovorax sp. dw_954 TaxID=2720078 RepID=UPI001BD20F80|nr:hypothetical protein [Variovorax sp. dw_954]
MTKFCESCHSANKDNAKYCTGCKGRFSGFRFSANTVAAEFADTREPSTAMYLPPWKPEPNSGIPTGKILLVMFVLLLAGAFAYWYALRPEEGRLPLKGLTTNLGQTTATPSEPARPVVIIEHRATSRRLVEGPPPMDAATAAAPGTATAGATPPRQRPCTEAHVALGLCPRR